MKIKTEHYNYMKEAMVKISDKISAHRERIKDDPRIKDMEKRIRWDWLYGAIPSSWICDNLYPYMNDTHLDTALRSIVAEIEKA